MTEIAFHVNTPDKIGYACRLLRKAWGAGSRVVVTGEPSLLQELDASLWTFSPADFIPHCYDAPEAIREWTPIVLADTPATAPALRSRIEAVVAAAVAEAVADELDPARTARDAR